MQDTQIIVSLHPAFFFYVLKLFGRVRPYPEKFYLFVSYIDIRMIEFTVAGILIRHARLHIIKLFTDKRVYVTLEREPQDIRAKPPARMRLCHGHGIEPDGRHADNRRQPLISSENRFVDVDPVTGSARYGKLVLVLYNHLIESFEA